MRGFEGATEWVPGLSFLGSLGFTRALSPSFVLEALRVIGRARNGGELSLGSLD